MTTPTCVLGISLNSLWDNDTLLSCINPCILISSKQLLDNTKNNNKSRRERSTIPIANRGPTPYKEISYPQGEDGIHIAG